MSRNGQQSSERRDRSLAAVFFILCWAFLQFVYPYHLIYKEQLTLFLCDGQYLSTLLCKPAFAAVAAGDFLTQFFLLDWMAPIITVAVSILLWAGLSRTIGRLPALLPVAAELALACIHEYPLSLTIGAAVAAWMAAGCLSINNIALRRALSIAAAVLAYPLVGAHALILIILVSAYERRSPLYAAGYIILSLAVIFTEGYLYRLTFGQTLPYPLIEGYLLGNTYVFLLTEVLLAVAVLLSICGTRWWITASAAVIAAAGGFYIFHDSRQEYDLEISTLAYYGKWDKVRQMGKENPSQSQTGAYYYNLSLAREGKLSNGLLDAYQPLMFGLFLPVSGTQSYLKVMASTDALMEAGDFAQAQHSALLGMTFTPNQRSSRMARKLTEVALANGDLTAAQKYVTMLKKTSLHKKWAEEAQDIIDEANGSAGADGLDNSFMPRNNYRDTMYLANDFTAGLRAVLDSGSGNAATVDYLLCFDLLDKNLPAFMKDFELYFKPRQTSAFPPRLYQEALAMYDAEALPGVSEAVFNANQDFLNGNHKKYKDSYWFYFLYAVQGE